MDTLDKLIFLNSIDPDHRSWWSTVDSIPSGEIVGWGETLAKSRDMEPKEWLQLCGILHWWRQHRDLTDSQRRWLTITVAVNLPVIDQVLSNLQSDYSRQTGFM